MFLYLIQNVVSGRCYLGITSKSLKQRWAGHLADTRRHHRNSPFHLAIRRYGEDAFIMNAICTAENVNDLKFAEQFAIALFRAAKIPLYNILDGGDGSAGRVFHLSPKHRAAFIGGNIGRHCSKKTREKISKTEHGKVVSLATRKKMHDAHSGVTLSATHCESIGKALKGRVFTPEWRAKISAAKTGIACLTNRKRDARGRLISSSQ